MINISRLIQLIKIYFYIGKKNIYITAVSIISLLFLSPSGFLINLNIYLFLLYTIGFIITGKAFNEIHDPRKAFHYLTLPCTNFERFLSKLLSTTLLFSLFLLFIFYLTSLLHFSYDTLFDHNSATLFDLTQSALWIGIGKYIIFQSIFLLGAAYFKNSAITKTTLFLACLFMLSVTLLFLFSKMVCQNCEEIELGKLIMQSGNGLYFIFWLLLAPCCWFGTYTLISKSEIK